MLHFNLRGHNSLNTKIEDIQLLSCFLKAFDSLDDFVANKVTASFAHQLWDFIAGKHHKKPRFRKEYLLKTRLTTLERITSNPSYHHYLKEDSEAALSEDVAMIVTFNRTMQKISRYIFPRCDVRGMWPTGESIWNQSMYVKWSKINFFYITTDAAPQIFYKIFPFINVCQLI